LKRVERFRMGMKNDQILNVLIYDDDGSSDDKYKI
jgi:hypothetical protein